MLKSRLIFCMVLAFAGFAVAATTITPVQPTLKNGCYEISNAAELYGFAAIVNGSDGFTKDTTACGKLTKDIVVNQNVLKSDGSLNVADTAKFAAWIPMTNFAGNFDGQNHTISGLFFADTTSEAYEHFGFIGSISGPSLVTLQNFGVVDSYFGTNYCGVGGIVGIILGNSRVSYTNVFSGVAIHAYGRSGASGGLVGTVGQRANVNMKNVYNRGSLVNDNLYVAGLIGNILSYGTVNIENAYNVGTIKCRFNGYWKSLIASSAGTLNIVNTYCVRNAGRTEYGGVQTSAEKFKNGMVALALHEGVDGSVWGQDAEKDTCPNFSGEIKNSPAKKYNVVFHTFEGDTAKYFNFYTTGFVKNLPATVVQENAGFLGWYDNNAFDGEPVASIDSLDTGDKEFWAKLRKSFKVTLNTNGGRIQAGKVESYTETEGAVLPTDMYRDSSIFAGWYDNEGLTGKPVAAITAEDTGDKTYYAAWFKMKMPALDEADNCYQISDAAELYGFAAYVSGTHRMYYNSRVPTACGKLTKDIVVNEHVLNDDGSLDSTDVISFLIWNPIDSFAGTFNGQGHTISGLYNSKDDGGSKGFFDKVGLVKDSVVIKNLGIKDTYFSGSTYVAGMVAHVLDRRATNIQTSVVVPMVMDSCYFEGTLVGMSSYVGGLVEEVTGVLNIRNSHVAGKISSAYGSAGLVADIAGTVTIDDSYNAANLFTETASAGGLVCRIKTSYAPYSSLNISNSYNTGNVVSNSNAAGLVASIDRSSNNNMTVVNIINSYNVGDITGAYAGGLVGTSDYSKFSLVQSYNAGDVFVSGSDAYAGGLVARMEGSGVIANNYNLGKVSHTTATWCRIGGLVGSGSISTVLNNYSMGEFSVPEGSYCVVDYVVAKRVSTFVGEHNFFLKTVDTLSTSNYGTGATAEAFKTDSVATALHDYVQKDGEGQEVEGGVKGTAWTQGDDYPILVTKDFFVVTFNANGGKLESTTTTYKYGVGLVLPIPTREGHIFKGWFTSKNLDGTAVTEITAKDAGDKFFYAKWEAKQFTVTVKVNNDDWGSVTGLNETGIYKYGDNVYLTAVADSGYSFSYWEDDVLNVHASRRYTVVGDTTLTAHFDPISPESSSSVTSSSSVEPPKSSSSVKSSSSSAKSSSSKKSSSSSAKSSSSSKKSSSSSKGKSSSSKQSLVAQAAIPQFSVEILGRNVQIVGARVGSSYAVLDMQGRVLRRGRVDSPNFSLSMTRSGTFLVQVGGQSVVARVR